MRATERLLDRDIDWDQGTLRLRHMKKVDEHTAILTERALERLRRRVAHLQKQPYWRETPRRSWPASRDGPSRRRPSTAC